MNNLFLNCNYILYIIHYFIEKIQKEPNKVMELIIKSQDNIEKKMQNLQKIIIQNI